MTDHLKPLADQLREAVAGGNADRIAAVADELTAAIDTPPTTDPTRNAAGQTVLPAEQFNALSQDQHVALIEADADLYTRSLAHAAQAPAEEGTS